MHFYKPVKNCRWAIKSCILKRFDIEDSCADSFKNDSLSTLTCQIYKSHVTDIGDLTRLVDYLFITYTPIYPLKVGDVNGDCIVDIGDLTRMIDYLFLTFTPLEVGCEGAVSGHGEAVAQPTMLWRLEE